MTDNQIDYLLHELNNWEQKFGKGVSAELIASTGEAPARIAKLKAMLLELGVTVEWNGKEYIIDWDEDLKA